MLSIFWKGKWYPAWVHTFWVNAQQINIKCSLIAYEKGPYVSNYSQWQTCHVLLHVLGNIDCKRHYTPHQDSFFVFQCYIGSTETFINIVSNTTACAISLITVFANLFRQAYPFRDQKPATNVRYYDNIERRNNTSSLWSSFSSSEWRKEKKPTANLMERVRFLYCYQLLSRKIG